MPTAHARINVAMDGGQYEAIRRIARREGLSLSAVARRLIREAMEREEDVVLAAWAEERERTFRPAKALSHEAVWGRAARRAQK
jgi:hypothetical protein